MKLLCIRQLHADYITSLKLKLASTGPLKIPMVGSDSMSVYFGGWGRPI